MLRANSPSLPVLSTENADSGDALRMIVFAGPNGSGKSTINEMFLANPANGFKGEYVNADAIAKQMEASIPDYYTRNVEAARIAEQRRQTALAEGRSFAFETVLSTPEKVGLLTQAQSKGYNVTLIFVTLNDPQLNVERVATRVAKGGHAVEPEAIVARYAKTMGLLASAIEHSDKAVVFDNSGTKAVVIASKENGKLSIRNVDAPAWVEQYLVVPTQVRARSLDAINSTIEQIKTIKPAGAMPIVVENANAENGRNYAGKVLAVASHHVLQQDVKSENLVVHDMALLAPVKLQPGQVVTLQYAYDKGKIVIPASDRER